MRLPIDPIWTIHPHGPLLRLAENLWTIEGTIHMPPGPLPRRMTIVRLSNGQLVVFSAIAVAEPELRAIEAIGKPEFLVVPNAFHREDAPAWKARYPQMRVITPKGARTSVEDVVAVDATDDIFDDPSVAFVPVSGTEAVESALIVRGLDGTSLVVNDIIGNVQSARGIMRPILSLMGFAGRRPQVPRMFVARVVKDKAAVAAQFREWSALPDLRRIIVSHGAIIDAAPDQVLLDLANRLG